MTAPRPADAFEALRPHLLKLAYRMLGEMAAAEDIVQETWLRWRAETAPIRDARAWLSTVTARLALDSLRSARSKRETYVGPWLPEPVAGADFESMRTPEDHAELASELSLALLLMLERLSPDERAAFILHDAFDSDYRDIAAVLGKSEDACRKLVSRARERVHRWRPQRSVSREAHRDLLARFVAATLAGDGARIRALLAPDAVFHSDGGGVVPAALNPILGADKVERLILGLMRKQVLAGAPDVIALEINGRPGIVLMRDGGVDSALDIAVDGDRIHAIHYLRNPEKLARLSRALAGRSEARR